MVNRKRDSPVLYVVELLPKALRAARQLSDWRGEDFGAVLSPEVGELRQTLIDRLVAETLAHGFDGWTLKSSIPGPMAP